MNHGEAADGVKRDDLIVLRNLSIRFRYQAVLRDIGAMLTDPVTMLAWG